MGQRDAPAQRTAVEWGAAVAHPVGAGEMHSTTGAGA